MLIHQPHDFGCIHSGTAAQSDDSIRSEIFQLFQTFLCALKSWIRSYIKEAVILDTHFIQLVCDRFCISALV